jgi:TonB family protein
MALSLIFHAAVISAVGMVSRRMPTTPQRVRMARMVFDVRPVQRLAFESPVVHLNVPRPRRPPEPLEPQVASVRDFTKPISTVIRHADPPASPDPARLEPVSPSPAVVPDRPVVVGLFPSSAGSVRRVEESREVRATGFDAPMARVADAKVFNETVGAFDRPVARTPAKSERSIAPTEFGSAAIPGQTSGQRIVAVRQVGFDAIERQPAAPVVRRPAERIDVPVNVAYKPVPRYSNEARALKLEGEVLLEVDFLATSELRVVRIVRGLGHGLDESAIEAAEQIRFTPARTADGPVTSRAIVHIVFKLT